MLDNIFTIIISENGQIKSIVTPSDVAVSPAENILNTYLRNPDISISEIRTIILMKLIRVDKSYTWVVKYPPESSFCGPCRRCRCIIASNVDDPLWIKSTDDKDSPSYISIQVKEDGDIGNLKIRDILLQPSESLMEKPLNLGDASIGEFQTITLIKLVKTNNPPIWVIKHPVELSSDGETTLHKYTSIGNLSARQK
jgi:hypothetical protein